MKKVHQKLFTRVCFNVFFLLNIEDIGIIYLVSLLTKLWPIPFGYRVILILSTIITPASFIFYFLDNSLNVVLENTLNKRQLRLKLSALGDSRVGITIDEENPTKERFRPTDSFAKTPIKRG